MEQSITILLLSTVSVGLIHTLIGPDHYVPFIALSRSRNWSMPKTLGITAACGIGHVLSALLIGLAASSVSGILRHLDIIESVRGEIAAWLLISFGFVYCVWGIRNAVKNKGHIHKHGADSLPHIHRHPRGDGHSHEHDTEAKKELTPWLLFIIFFFGPCEPLIPLVMYPAVQASAFNVVLVTLVFGMSTLAVMLGVVITTTFGIKKFFDFPFFARWGNALSGGIICSCGLAMNFLGL